MKGKLMNGAKTMAMVLLYTITEEVLRDPSSISEQGRLRMADEFAHLAQLARSVVLDDLMEEAMDEALEDKSGHS